jgi:ABC-type multidrug transport system fused ATPase/permease subunit
MSYVSQGDHIVDDTIRDNLSWGFSKTGSISPERMRDIIDVVAINTSNKGGDILDLLAKDLSIGEQQRLSIARMMLDESEIVIMDEPLAGVDVFTIRDLLPHLTRLLRERNHTVVMISHRLAFAGCADHVVVLNGIGEVVEQGAPKDLILSNGVFASLHEAAVAELSLTSDPGH